MISNAKAIVKAAIPELRFLRWGLMMVMGIVFVLGSGSIIEARIAPIIIYQSASSIHQEPDNRLCWDWHYIKTRRATAFGAYARLYLGDDQNPILVGVEHGDGSPFGTDYSDLSGAPISEPWSVRTCIRVPPSGWSYYRLGVQPVVVYKDNPFWMVTQYGTWVDYYKGDLAPQGIAP